MLVCAEDLGVVPPYVYSILKNIGILGLKVERWQFDKLKHSFMHPKNFDSLSVCTPSTHDMTNIREWCEYEISKSEAKELGLPYREDPSSKVVWETLKRNAESKSQICIYSIQDIFALTDKWRLKNSFDERINIPGTSKSINWTYKIPYSIEDICLDKELIKKVSRLVRIRNKLI